jgi:hypothetical protein
MAVIVDKPPRPLAHSHAVAAQAPEQGLVRSPVFFTTSIGQQILTVEINTLG